MIIIIIIEGYGAVAGTGSFFPSGIAKKLEVNDILKIQREKFKLIFYKNDVPIVSCSTDKQLLFPTVAFYNSGQISILKACKSS